MVAALDAAFANGFFEGERDGRARGVPVLVDVDGHAPHRQADAPRGGVDDPEVGLVRHPQVDIVQRDTRGLADLGRLPDEDVDRELEHVWADHVDVGLRVLRRVGPLLDVAAGHLRITAAVRTETPAEETGPLRRGSHYCSTRSVSEYDRRAAVVVL